MKSFPVKIEEHYWEKGKDGPLLLAQKVGKMVLIWSKKLKREKLW